MIGFTGQVWRGMRVRWWRLFGPSWLRSQGVQVEGRVSLLGLPIVSTARGSHIEIRERVTLISDARFTALGVSRPVILRALEPRARIVIGRDSGLSGTTVCAALSVTIGERCLIGADVVIADTDFHAVSPDNRRYGGNADRVSKAPVSIADDVFIGARALVLKGVSIGRGSVIGAGSVVTKDIPSGVVAAGNPARVISDIPLKASPEC